MFSSAKDSMFQMQEQKVVCASSSQCWNHPGLKREGNQIYDVTSLILHPHFMNLSKTWGTKVDLHVKFYGLCVKSWK